MKSKRNKTKQNTKKAKLILSLFYFNNIEKDLRLIYHFLMKFLQDKKAAIFNASTILIILTGIIVRIFAYFNNLYYIPIDDCHSLYRIDTVTLEECFTVFLQGANFLPLYKTLLFGIYKICGYNFLALKMPSLIVSISILPLAFILLKKMFQNKLIIATVMLLLAFNYNLIYFGTRLKPYIFDVFFSILILNTVISISAKSSIISLKQTIKYAISSIIIFFFSIPNLALIELYFGILFIKNIIEKQSANIKKLILFQILTLPFLLAEYFTYIKQIQEDSGLKSQWTTDLFYYAPKSLDAVNALINYVYFRFFWWDTTVGTTLSKYTIIAFLLIFVAGSVCCAVNSIKRKDTKDILLIAAVYTFLLLSYLGFYPFCNRQITFLIPIIIFVTFKPFDYKTNKYIQIILNIAVLAYLALFAKHALNSYEIQAIISDNNISTTIKSLMDTLKNTNPNTDILLGYGAICAPCLGNKNFIEINEFTTENNNISIKYIEKKQNTYNEACSINELTANKTNIYFLLSENTESDESKKIENLITQQGYNFVEEKDSPFVNYKVFTK